MDSCNGSELTNIFDAGSNWLEKSTADINAINVFPVPDGDTGTNMSLTMRSTMEEAHRASDASVSAVIKAMARGALMGARGNSGVILSQIFRGLANGLDGKETITGSDWADALVEASRTAYKGLSQPVEGTILTVIRDASTAAEVASQTGHGDLVSVTEAAVKEAKDSVARTPLLLPVLREAGVVDAGGQGLYILLEGVLRYLKGDMEETQYRKPQMVAAEMPLAPDLSHLVAEVEEPYGYCTNFLLQGEGLNPDKIRRKLESKGQSLVVTGDEDIVRVHIHTHEPGVVLRYVTSLGTLHQIQIQNMDDQYASFVEMQQQRLPTLDIAIVSIASGDGIAEVFKSLGVAAVVSGGQTMNPSVKEVLEAVDSVPSRKVIILPNNKNIILTASQVPPLTSKEVAVIPTKTITQGIAALLGFSYDGGLEGNVNDMTDAAVVVKTVEITKAVRSTQVGGLEVREGQFIGIIDDKDLVAAGDNIVEVIFEAVSKADIESAEVVTIYYGIDIKVAEAEDIVQGICNKYPEKQLELVNGGQPHYEYIISLE